MISRKAQKNGLPRLQQGRKHNRVLEYSVPFLLPTVLRLMVGGVGWHLPPLSCRPAALSTNETATSGKTESPRR